LLASGKRGSFCRKNDFIQIIVVQEISFGFANSRNSGYRAFFFDFFRKPL
jgi:hypothetical protein